MPRASGCVNPGYIIRDTPGTTMTRLERLDELMRGKAPKRGLAPSYVGALWSAVPPEVREAIAEGLISPAPLTVIHGESRVGKTRALWAARRHAVEMGDRRSWLIASAESLLESRGSLDQDLWREAHAVDILGVDDLLEGLPRWTPVQLSRITTLLTDRHGHPTLCTDNRNPLTITWSKFSAEHVRLAGRLAEAQTVEHPQVDY